jgi:hypothetical protein
VSGDRNQSAYPHQHPSNQHSQLPHYHSTVPPNHAKYESAPFTTLQPVFWHISIDAYHHAHKIGTFRAIDLPTAPSGEFTLIETGQTLVMIPDYTVAWYIDSFSINRDLIIYMLTNNAVRVIRYLEVLQKWSYEGGGKEKMENGGEETDGFETDELMSDDEESSAEVIG